MMLYPVSGMCGSMAASGEAFRRLSKLHVMAPPAFQGSCRDMPLRGRRARCMQTGFIISISAGVIAPAPGNQHSICIVTSLPNGVNGFPLQGSRDESHIQKNRSGINHCGPKNGSFILLQEQLRHRRLHQQSQKQTCRRSRQRSQHPDWCEDGSSDPSRYPGRRP